MNPKPKITDVAKASGVSIATVSHVINGTRPVSEETAAKVNAAKKDDIEVKKKEFDEAYERAMESLGFRIKKE